MTSLDDVAIGKLGAGHRCVVDDLPVLAVRVFEHPLPSTSERRSSLTWVMVLARTQTIAGAICHIGELER
jgi:hypothetical protein